MSKEYERRLELEALPAEPGYTKWEGIVGSATILVERKQLAPVAIWVVGAGGPRQVAEAYRYERWRFAEETNRWFCYTEWHNNTEYTDYSERCSRLEGLCAVTREELCKKALALTKTELTAAQAVVAKLKATRAKFQ